MGSHRVGDDWSDLAAAAAAVKVEKSLLAYEANLTLGKARRKEEGRWNGGVSGFSTSKRVWPEDGESLSWSHLQNNPTSFETEPSLGSWLHWAPDWEEPLGSLASVRGHWWILTLRRLHFLQHKVWVVHFQGHIMHALVAKVEENRHSALLKGL